MGRGGGSLIPTFSDFVKFLLKNGPYFNQHVWPFFYKCGYCELPYQYIGKTGDTGDSTVLPRILLHAVKSEVYQHFELRLLVANCMQLLPEGLYSGPAIIG